MVARDHWFGTGWAGGVMSKWAFFGDDENVLQLNHKEGLEVCDYVKNH